MVKLLDGKSYSKENLITILESNRETMLSITLVLSTILLLISIVMLIVINVTTNYTEMRTTGIVGAVFFSMYLLFYYTYLDDQLIALTKEEVNTVIKELNVNDYDKFVLITEKNSSDFYIDNVLYATHEDVKEGKFNKNKETD